MKLEMPVSTRSWGSPLATLLFLLALATVSVHSYRTPTYGMDMLGYMGNAVAIGGAGIGQIHAEVYAEVATELPTGVRQNLLGQDGQGPSSQQASRQDRARNPYHFAEYLPCFAVRPLYNESIFLLHTGVGIGFIRATVIIATVSFVLISILIFAWMSAYLGAVRAAPAAMLVILTPPLFELSRMSSPDGLACLCGVAGLYLIFERRALLPGFVVLLGSVYVRTDNALLAIAVIVYCAVVSRQISKTAAAVLCGVAATSVLTINHFAGDYGLQMLYYRSFVSIPLAPGEVQVHFGLQDYANAFRSAVAGLAGGYFLPFLLMGAIGIFAKQNRRSIGLAAVGVAYAASHFALFPSAQERFFGPVYVVMAITMAMGVAPVSVERPESVPVSLEPTCAESPVS